MQPAAPASPMSALAASRPRAASSAPLLRRRCRMRPQAAGLPLVAVWALTAVAAMVPGAQGVAQSEVRVRFSSPQLSYEHGHLGSPRAYAPGSALPLPLPLQRALPTASPPPLTSQGHVRRGRLVQFVLAPDDIQLPSAISAFAIQDATDPLTPSVEEDDALLALPPAPALLARVLASPIFFGTFPHAETLLRYERGREAAGLGVDRLGSARPESPFYRWPSTLRARRRSGSGNFGNTGNGSGGGRRSRSRTSPRSRTRTRDSFFY